MGSILLLARTPRAVPWSGTSLAVVRASWRSQPTCASRSVSPRRTPPGSDTGRTTPRRARNDRNAAVEALDADVRARFETLRAWRRDRASEQHVPPYVIFQDKTLLEIAQREPGSLDALAAISGVGQTKIDRYGKGVLEALGAL